MASHDKSRDADSLQAEVIAFLSDPRTHGGAPVSRVTTHISELFLAGDRAYKLKRAVTLPFLDYAGLAERKAACCHELALNRRTAPALYHAVRAVTRETDGGLALDGAGPAVDWLVEMTRFPKGAEADQMARAGTLTLTHAARLADHLADFHMSLAPDHDHGSPADLRLAITDLAATLKQAGNSALAAEGRSLAQRLLARLDNKTAQIESRRAAGKVRLCHGDLHLGNIVVIADDPVPFDGIEFNDRIATIDILFDLAFAVMDFLAHDLPDHANLMLNRYLAITRDYDGLDLLPLYLGTRALIRLMAELMSGRDARAAGYLAVADAVLAPAPARVIAVGGLSGSGKSTVARGLAPYVGAPPGAVLLRSDEIRKRLHGVAPEVTLPAAAYEPAVTRAVFDRMDQDARAALAAGATVILDATHMAPAARARAEAIAASAGLPFTGLWLDAPLELLASRVGNRVHDASDATVAVLHDQATADLGVISWVRIDASTPAATAITAARAALCSKEAPRP